MPANRHATRPKQVQRPPDPILVPLGRRGLGDRPPQLKRDLVAVTEDGELMCRVSDDAVGQGPD
jgi:hypothetical protein